jgi:hypothetical protein
LVFKFLSSKNRINIGPDKLKNNAQNYIDPIRTDSQNPKGPYGVGLNQSLDKMAASFAKA